MLKNTLRSHLSQFVTEADLQRWFDPLELLHDKDSSEVVVEFPHAYFAQWFDARVKEHFEKQLGLLMGQGCVLRYRSRTRDQALDASMPRPQPVSVDFPFGHEYTFEQFFTNHKNLFPLASAKDISRTREAKFNPLIIQGEPGTGKTHLMRCMANEVSKAVDKKLIFVGDMDELAELYTSGHRQGQSVRSALASCRAFFLDDLHRLEDYPLLASELLSLFNAFTNDRSLMVFTTAAPLAACGGMPAELRTRLESGLMVQLAPPDLDVRMKYVQDRCQKKQLQLSKSQMLTLAQSHRDFRSLLGVLNKFQAFRELLKRDISDAIFENILGRSKTAKAAKATPDSILELVAERFKVDKRDLLGSRRTKDLVLARQIAMLLCREELGLSYPALGKLFGGKDHSTVLYGVKKIHKLQNDSNDMKNLVNTLRKSCQQTNA
ncbi:helix-turn-helix domain-containing protein [Fundidesulfovibrio soli]|uniref:helix-turn-helix domain-containing protein n=1 Tax=Fundidesulfovibrio soli TaxID=2922716 RepID=UPI001FAF4BD0